MKLVQDTPDCLPSTGKFNVRGDDGELVAKVTLTGTPYVRGAHTWQIELPEGFEDRMFCCESALFRALEGK